MPTVRTNEQAPEQPRAPPAEQLLSLRQALERQQKLKELRTNVGGLPPLTPESSDQLMQRREVGFSFQRLFDVFIGGRSDVTGLGFTVPSEQIQAMSFPMRINMLRQLSWIDQRGLDAIGRLKLGILRGAVERTLFRQGYRKVGDVVAARAQHIAAEMTVQACLMQGGQTLPAELSAPRSGSEGQPHLAGILDLSTPVPEGWYLHVSEDGLPLYIAPRDLTREPTAPSITVYRRDLNAQPRSAPALQEEKLREHAEFLEHTLEPGDILLASGAESQWGIVRLFRRMVRKLTARTTREESLPYTHAMVYTGKDTQGRGKIYHIRIAGKEEMTIEETLRKYPQLSVARPRAPLAARQQFAERMQQYAREEVQTFNTAGLIGQGIQNIRRKISELFGGRRRVEDTTAQPGSCVCIDYVSEPARRSQNTAIRRLRDITSPVEAMAHENIEVLYSIDAYS